LRRPTGTGKQFDFLKLIFLEIGLNLHYSCRR